MPEKTPLNSENSKSVSPTGIETRLPQDPDRGLVTVPTKPLWLMVRFYMLQTRFSQIPEDVVWEKEKCN